MTAEDERRLEELRAAWLGGGSAAPLVGELVRLRRFNEAGTLARLVLGRDDCEDRDELEDLLQQAGAPPPGWADAVMAFAEDPTPGGWERLMRFTPNKVLYQRTRNTIRILRRLGTDPNVVFKCATRFGTVPDAYELVQSGEVDPETVLTRAMEAPEETRALWYGMAAEAAFARGDHLGTVRLLKVAHAAARDGIGPEMSERAIRAEASHEFTEMLNSSGIPRFDDFG